MGAERPRLGRPARRRRAPRPVAARGLASARRRRRCTPSHSARGRPAAGKAPAPPSTDVERLRSPAAASHGRPRARLDRSSSVGPRKRRVRWRPSSRTQRTSRPPPRHAERAPTAARRAPRRRVDRRLGQGHGHEEPPAGQVRAGPASRLGEPVIATGRSCPVSRSQVARSARRTSSARSRSRQPRILTVLSSSALYVCEEVLDLDQPVRPDLVERARCAAGGRRRSATHRTLKSKPFSSRISSPPIGRAQTWQPVNVGSSMIRRASVWSPSPARVSLDEAVVEVVEDGAREDPIEAEDARPPRRTRTCSATRAGSRRRSRRRQETARHFTRSLPATAGQGAARCKSALRWPPARRSPIDTATPSGGVHEMRDRRVCLIRAITGPGTRPMPSR